MIYLDKNTLNAVILTLSESTSNDNFLFEFTYEDDSSTPIYFTTPDLSITKIRYNKFELTDSDAGSVVGGNDIPLNLKNGQWKYSIYSTNIIIDIDNIDWDDYTYVEEGRMVVNGINVTIDSRYN